jgi:hypothetical protein
MPRRPAVDTSEVSTPHSLTPFGASMGAFMNSPG